MAGGEPIDITGGRDHPPRVFDKRVPGDEPRAAWRVVTALAGDSGKVDNETQVLSLDAAVTKFHPAVKVSPAESAGQRIDLEAVSREPVGSGLTPAAPHDDSSADGIMILLVDWTFGTDTLSAMTPALNKVACSPVGYMHSETISLLGLIADQPVTVSINGSRLTLDVQADQSMAPGVMVIPRHHLLDWQVFGETRVMVDRSQFTAQGL
jgi:hypothetical protein